MRAAGPPHSEELDHTDLDHRDLRIRDLERRLAELECRTSRGQATGRQFASVPRWTRLELEQLRVKQLCRWVEELRIDISPVLSRSSLVTALWHEIQLHRPPALAAVQRPQDLERWSLLELLHWLEYFGHAEEQVVNKGALVMLLLQQRHLVTPAFLDETEEDEYMGQVQRHLTAMKTSIAVTLDHLLQSAQDVEKELWDWWPNGRMASAFLGPHRSGSCPLQLQVGEVVDVEFHETSGWAWVVATNNGGQGWVPASKVFEVARIVSEPHEENGREGMLVVHPGDEVEVVSRHYTGWTLCKRFNHRSPSEDAGWVPDACLSDHPRNAARKTPRLLGSALYRLAGEVLAAESEFSRLAACVQHRMGGAIGFEAQLGAVYEKVLGISEEYHRIQTVLQGGQLGRPESNVAASPAPPLLPPATIPNPPALASPNYSLSTLHAASPKLGLSPVTPRECPATDLLDPGSVPGISSAHSSSLDSHRSTISVSSKKVSPAKEEASSLSLQTLESGQRRLTAASLVQGTVRRLQAQELFLQLWAEKKADQLKREQELSARLEEEEVQQQRLSAALAMRCTMAQKIQAVCRTLLSTRLLLSLQQESATRCIMVLKIQAASRTWLCARFLQSFQREAATRCLELRKEAAVRLQSTFRGWRARRALERASARRQAAACCIQGLLRMREARLAARGRRRERREQEKLCRLASAVLIERHARGLLSRRKWRPVLQQRRRALLHIQVCMRSALARTECLRLRAAADTNRQEQWMSVYCIVRSLRHLRGTLAQQHRAALLMQGRVRVWQARCQVKRLRLDCEAARRRALALLRASVTRHTARTELQRRKKAVTCIQGLLHIWQAKCRVMALREAARLAAEEQEQAQLREHAATLLQSCWRAFQVRFRVLPLRQHRQMAAVRLQGLVHMRRAKTRLEELRQNRATLCLSALLPVMMKALQARQCILGLSMAQQAGAATKLQTFWRSCIGWRAGLRLRSRAVAKLLDALLSGEVSEEAPMTDPRSHTWLWNARKALSWQEAQEGKLQDQEALARRRLKGGRLELVQQAEDVAGQQKPRGARVPPSFLAKRSIVRGRGGLDETSGDEAENLLLARRHAAVAALDREESAYGIMQERKRLRRRALLLTQVRPAEQDAPTACALRVSAGLLARLQVGDAAEEVGSLIQMAWAVAVASRSRRQWWAPAPLEMARQSVKGLLDRLRAELGRAQCEGEAGLNEVAMQTEEQVALQLAERRVTEVRERVLGSLLAEQSSLASRAKEVLALARAALDRTDQEITALRQLREMQANDAESAMRAERERLHSQSTALEELHVATQLEKERLDAALTERKPKARVFQKILQNVKRLHQEVREQEVKGQLNRSNRGILEHALRSLESRSMKALQGTKQTDHLVPVSNENGFASSSSGGIGVDPEHSDGFQPSFALLKRQEAQASAEKRFQTSLEADMSALRAEHASKMAREVNVLGGKLSVEARVSGEEARRVAMQIAAWRSSYAESCPWLDEVSVLARVTTAALAISSQVRCAPQLNTARAAIPRLELLLHSIQTEGQSGEADPTIKDVFHQLQSDLEEVCSAIAELRAEYPSVVHAAPGREDGGLDSNDQPLRSQTSETPQAPTPTPRQDPLQLPREVPLKADEPGPTSASAPAQALARAHELARAAPKTSVSPIDLDSPESNVSRPEATPPDHPKEHSSSRAELLLKIEDAEQHTPCPAAPSWPATPPVSRLAKTPSKSRPGSAYEDNPLTQREATSLKKGQPAPGPTSKGMGHPRSDKVGASLRPVASNSPFTSRSSSSARGTASPMHSIAGFPRLESEPSLKGRPSTVKPTAAQGQGPALRAVQKARQQFWSEEAGR